MPRKHGTKHDLEAQIVSMLNSQPVTGFRRADIRSFLGKVDDSYFRQVFKKLIAEGKIVRKPGGRYVCADAVMLKRGTIHMNAKGFGFVHFEDGTQDAFIPPESTAGALSGDQVLVKLDSDWDARGPSGSVRKVISRGHESFVGCLAFGADGFYIRPLRRELPAVIPLISEQGGDPTGGAEEGDWIQARLIPGRHSTSPVKAEVMKRLAASGSVVNDLNAIVKEYGLPKKYTAADERKLDGIQPLSLPREDYTNLMAVTIDPIDAKDFDDAISCTPGPMPDTVIVGVHIADVACYVTPDSQLDNHARERGFTSYLPGRTLPMLPELLSNDLCSLRAGEDRLAHSVMMTLDLNSGRILDSKRVHSIVRVSARLTFSDVARCLAGEDAPIDKPIADLLHDLNRAAQALREFRRNTELFLPVVVPEYRVLCGGRPIRVQGVTRNEPTPASELVEEFMLATNVQVAQELQEKKVPALYRTHAEPDMKALGDFSALAGAVLGKRRAPDLEERYDLIQFLQKLAGHTSGDLLAMSFLRCLPRAQYGTDCIGHFGLGKEAYCHFTSPIRRYPDLLVHQQLIALDTGRKLRSMDYMNEQAGIVNSLELNNDQAGFAALDRMKLRYLENIRKEQPAQYHEAYVLKASSDILTLFLPAYGLMGIMENNSLGDSRWFFDKSTSSLVNRTGQGYRCGSVIFVQIKTIDAIHGELILKPVQMNI